MPFSDSNDFDSKYPDAARITKSQYVGEYQKSAILGFENI